MAHFQVSHFLLRFGDELSIPLPHARTAILDVECSDAVEVLVVARGGGCRHQQERGLSRRAGCVASGEEMAVVGTWHQGNNDVCTHCTISKQKCAILPSQTPSYMNCLKELVVLMHMCEQVVLDATIPMSISASPAAIVLTPMPFSYLQLPKAQVQSLCGVIHAPALFGRGCCSTLVDASRSLPNT